MKIEQQLFSVFIVILIFQLVYCSVNYRVVSKGPNGTKAEINIKENALYWTLILRFDKPVKLRVNSGGKLISSTSEGRIYIVAGSPTGTGQQHSVVFESKYDKKSMAKLISATYNGRPVKIA